MRLHLYDLPACFSKYFYELHLSTNDLWCRLTLEGTRESVWTCACPRLMESGIEKKLERNGTIALAFWLKPALCSDYILHAPVPPHSAYIPCNEASSIACPIWWKYYQRSGQSHCAQLLSQKSVWHEAGRQMLVMNISMQDFSTAGQSAGANVGLDSSPSC